MMFSKLPRQPEGPFGHPSQVCAHKLHNQTSADLRLHLAWDYIYLSLRSVSLTRRHVTRNNFGLTEQFLSRDQSLRARGLKRSGEKKNESLFHLNILRCKKCKYSKI